MERDSKSVARSVLKSSVTKSIRLDGRTMGKNFMAMPPLLKLLTAMTVGVPIFCIASMFPHQSIGVFGQQITVSEWWSSGAGLTTLVVGVLMLAAGLLMLRRSRYGRPAFILGLIAVSLSAPLISYLTESDFPAKVPSLLSNLVVTVLIGLYLYKSRTIQSYFVADPTTVRSREK